MNKIGDTDLTPEQADKLYTEFMERDRAETALLKWISDDVDYYEEAVLGTWPEDGVLFTITCCPTCYRRGKWRLLIEICGGENHHCWGCFDDQDQPMRWFHSIENAKSESEAIAQILWKDRHGKKSAGSKDIEP